VVLLGRASGAWIDLSRRCEKTKSVSNFYDLLILDLSVRAARDYFEEIAVRPNRGCREMAQFQASHIVLRHYVLDAIDLDFETVVLTSLVRTIDVLFILTHRNLHNWYRGIMIPRYHGS